MVKKLVVAEDLPRAHISNLIQALLLCIDNLPLLVLLALTWISILEFNFNSGLNCNPTPLHNIKSC